MLLGGAPLKMRLKKSCRSAGLVGPVVCSDGDLEAKDGKYMELFFFLLQTHNLKNKKKNNTININLKITLPVTWRIAVL